MEISDSDYVLLKQEAAARGISVEQLLVELGQLPELPKEEKPQPAHVSPEPVSRQAMPEFEITEDDESAGPSGVADLPLPPEEPTEEATPQVSSGPGTLARVCPHCGVSPATPPLSTPTREDKLLFLQCLLGDTLFKKEYTAFGGNVRFAFRTLRTAELDLIYQEAFDLKSKNIIQTAEDFYQHVFSTRVYVQLLSVTSTFGIRHGLPDGLLRRICPEATSTWDELCPENEAKESLFTRITGYINSKVLRTEPIMSAAKTFCEDFNKLVVTLELNKNNDPFWKEIETPP
jgi:hypothetical protein